MSDETNRRDPGWGWWSMKIKLLSTADWIILTLLGAGSAMGGVATYMVVF